jgi:tetratricopeptide (TPR) repeat protein
MPMSGKSSYKLMRGSRFVKRHFVARAYLFAIALFLVSEAAHAYKEDDVASQLKKAIAYHDEADYGHSIPILKAIVQESRGHYLANLLLGEDLFHSGAIQDAIAPLEAACRARPKDAVAELYLADAAASLGDFPVAAAALQAGIARSGGSGRYLEAWASYCLERYRLLGLTLRTTKRGEAVMLRVEAASHPEGSAVRESLLKQSAATDPEQPGIWGELGIAQLELHHHADALESLKTGRTREPQDAQTLQLEALLAATEQNWPEAEEGLKALEARSPAEFQNAVTLWRHVLSSMPSSGTIADCLRATATCKLASNQPNDGTTPEAKALYAEGQWERLIALPLPDGDDGIVRLWKGVAVARTGNCAQAIPVLESGLKADELTAGFWLEVCYSGEAERMAYRLKAEKDQGAFHQFRGDVLLRLQGDAAAARVQYEEALTSRPDDPSLLERLAEAYIRLGDTEHAQEAAQKSLAMDPHRVETLRILASLAMNNRDYNRALRWLRQLVAETPADTAARVQLGSALAHTGNAPEAIRYLAPALAGGYPDERGALHSLEARVLRELGRDVEAAKAADEARRLSDAFQAQSKDSTYGTSDANQ